MMPDPVAFLCHASEDKSTVRALASNLMSLGVDVFFDEWEVGPGDSIRGKIDEGLGRCTHFIAVLSAVSVGKPWVKLEMDAGLVARVEGQAIFIPLRLDLQISSLPPLLRGMYSPELCDAKRDAAALANFMHGVSLKPPPGSPPTTVKAASQRLDLSPAAEAIAKLIVLQSRDGRRFDPQLSPSDLTSLCGLEIDDVVDGVEELEELGFVEKHACIGTNPFGFVAPEANFFWVFDAAFGFGDPRADALRIAADLTNTGRRGADIAELAADYDWAPRRMNPAATYLAANSLVLASSELNSRFTPSYVAATPATRRFSRLGNG